MARKFVAVGILCLASVVVAGVVSTGGEENKDKGKEPEKKPNILRDYHCLREGDLCHPDFARNRGLYVSCSNGLAYEQQCPKCSYHSLNCPTRTLWFDGEKCEWASPKLASLPCIDHFPITEVSGNTEKQGVFSGNSLSGNLHVPGLPVPMKEPVDKNKWQINSMSIAAPVYYKSPKFEETEKEADIDVSAQQETKDATENAVAAEEEMADSSKEESTGNTERKSVSESDYPSYVNPEDNTVKSSKIVRLSSEPVYTLVNNPDGSGKQILVRIAQPFVLANAKSSALPNMNIISPYSKKE